MRCGQICAVLSHATGAGMSSGSLWGSGGRGVGEGRGGWCGLGGGGGGRQGAYRSKFDL